MFETGSYLSNDMLPLLPLYQSVLNADIGGLAPEIVRLSGDTEEWCKVVVEAKTQPQLEQLLSGIRVTKGSVSGINSEQIDNYLWGLSLAGKLILDLDTGIYRIEPQIKSQLYRRNIARLAGQEERIALLSTKLAYLAS